MSSFSDALQAAQSHLDAAQFCFEHNREGLSASEAYHAMYHAVRAWALQEEGDAPGTHKGMGLFIHRRVEQDRLDPALRDQFHDARASRERWHYQSLDPLPTVETEALVTAAGTLIEKVEAR
jgi:uncharacterized protein (UPF0332 family)